MYYRNTGILEQEIWWIDKHKTLKHRFDGPANIKYDGNGTIRHMEWCQYGMIHRLDGPAIIGYDKNGNITEKSWGHKNLGHRDDGPSNIIFHGGKPVYWVWRNHGKYHRLNGPAVYSALTDVKYALCGDVLSKKIFDEVVLLENAITKTPNINLAILHCKHKYAYIRNACERILNEKI
jgi:hypothetical protein